MIWQVLGSPCQAKDWGVWAKLVELNRIGPDQHIVYQSPSFFAQPNTGQLVYIYRPNPKPKPFYGRPKTWAAAVSR